jgi:hypothetical protein
MLTALLILSAGCSSEKHDSASNDTDIKGLKSAGLTEEEQGNLVAYYFHPTARCETCLNIEAYSKQAVDSWAESKGKKVAWNALNIDDTSNEHFRNNFNLQFSSLIIAEYRDDKVVKWKNLVEIWNLANDKKAFIGYVASELEHFFQ